MRNIFSTLLTISFVCLFSCSDGGIIDVKLDFENKFSAKTCSSSNLVLYKTKNAPSESLSIIISSFTLDEIFEVGDDKKFNTTKSGTFNYRTYSNAKISGGDLFCNDIPPSDINIIDDYTSNCSVEITTTLTEDDNDGVPANLENQDPNGDGDFSDALNTDGDTLPNYLDFDDDGDNIPTKDEDLNKDGDPTNDDTDGDNIPNYLDDDDDGDGVKTRDEENDTQDNNPTNDITNPDVGPDYLNKDVKTTVAATAYREHIISKVFTVNAEVTNISIDIITLDKLSFGTLTDSSKLTGTRKETPPFN